MPVVIDQTVDAESIAKYLSFLWCPGSGTPLNSVKKLPPGEAMIVKMDALLINGHGFAFQCLVKAKSNMTKNNQFQVLEGI